jgi:nitroreductase
MDLEQALRTTGAVRNFTDQTVSEETVAAVLEVARFAPSGGNRQGWHVVVVRDPQQRRRLRDLYLASWYDYLAIGESGLVAFAPITDREAEARAVAARSDAIAEESAQRPGFAEHLDQVPVLLVVVADLRSLCATDRDLDRYTLVGGASVYPFVWSILLAARIHGLGGVITTMLTRAEPEVRDVLGVPDTYAVVAGVALGYPVKQPQRLRRGALEGFATIDRFDGAPLPTP